MHYRSKRLRRYTGLVGLAGVLFHAGCKAENVSDIRSRPEHSSEIRTSVAGAVLPIAAGRRLLDQCSRRSAAVVTGFWHPSQAMIAALERHLPQYIDGAAGPWPTLREGVRQNAYYRQYIGVVRWNGKRSIYVNAFHRSHLEALNSLRRQIAQQQGQSRAETVNWRRSPIVVCDGGQHFFGIEYHPETGEFTGLRINATADGSR
jgi:hypothetical protein